MEETKILMEKLDTQAKRQDDMRNQLDKDRQDIDQLRIGQETIQKQLETLLKNTADFKEEVRQMVKDTISSETPNALKTAVENELDNIRLNNPKKVFVVYYGLAEIIKKLFRHDKRKSN